MTPIDVIVGYLIHPARFPTTPLVPPGLFEASADENAGVICRQLNAAFLVTLAGEGHPDFEAARACLRRVVPSAEWGDLARFFLDGAERIVEEVGQRLQQEPGFRAACEQATRLLEAGSADERAASEIIWSMLFPEGTGLRGHEERRLAQLRKRRTVTVRRLNPEPILRPTAEILFTSNVLLTTPPADADLSPLDRMLAGRLVEAVTEPQRHWYDHPILIGAGAESNEILYGLRHLDEAVAEEHRRHPGARDRVTCVLSVSVTHGGLEALGRPYLEQVLASGPQLDHLDLFAFLESDCESLRRRVLLPIVERFAPEEDAADLLSVVGVDGRYGRHYSFLKAIAALWHVLVDPAIHATFKIDLDQVFPQQELVAETGRSAFEHLQTPLWGATGEDASGRPVDLGMVAGTLVNQRDIHKGLFTPDVSYPLEDLAPDEFVFCSRLPHALSTAAETVVRYGDDAVPDGRRTCLERIHVTGGTTGILVSALRRFRPFTPGFVGRAEDQAYVLSTFDHPVRLGHAHASGLVMRHDKEGFAHEAIAAAKVGKEIGDYERILVFSAYARALGPEMDEIKALVDPFTGCFISRLPVSVVLLRFALKLATLFGQGKTAEALEYVRTGVERLREALEFTSGDPSALQRAYEREQRGWRLFYDGLDEVERGLQAGEAWAEAVRKAARETVVGCRIGGLHHGY
jgi:hypothetical protein